MYLITLAYYTTLNINHYLNGVEFKIFDSNQGTFTLYEQSLQGGVNSIKVEIITSSGTGSIADVLGYEGFEVTSQKEWLIKVVHPTTYNYEITTEEKDGYLHLKWPECPWADFKDYSITLSSGQVIKTTNVSLLDSSYIGKEAGYVVKVNTKYGYSFNWASCHLSSSLPILSLYINNGYNVVWSKSKYYSAIKKWVLYSGSTIFKETIDSNDTICSSNSFVFGSRIGFSLRVVPKISGTYSSAEVKLNCTIGEVCPHFDFFSPINNTEFIFIYNYDGYANTIYKYSTVSNSIIEQRTHQPTSCTVSWVSQLDDLNASVGGTYLTANINCNSILRGSCSDLDSYSINDFPDYNDYYSKPVSDNGRGILITKDLKNLVLYDFINNSILGQLNLSYLNDSFLQISSNGDYFTYTANYYPIYSLFVCRFLNNQISNVGTYPINSIKYVRFSSTNPNELAILVSNTFYIKNLNESSVVYEHAFNDDKLLDIDFHNQQYLTLKGSTLIVRELTTGDSQFEMLVTSNLYNSYATIGFRLINNTIFHPSGIMHKIVY